MDEPNRLPAALTGAEVARVAGTLAFQYDREADILHIGIRPPGAEQESEELGDDVIARLDPKTGDLESLEVLFFSHSRSSCCRCPLGGDARPQRDPKAARPVVF